jgi:hypothetical protein
LGVFEVSWIFWVFVIAIIIFLFILRAGKGPARSLEELHKPIDELLKRGFDGGFLLINISYSKKFIQLRKYINSDDSFGIELVFPKAKWSSRFFDKIKNFCKDNDIHYLIRREKAKHTLNFLYVDFGNDSKRAYEIVKKILLDVFEIKENTKLFLRLENATLEKTLH